MRDFQTFSLKLFFLNEIEGNILFRKDLLATFCFDWKQILDQSLNLLHLRPKLSKKFLTENFFPQKKMKKKIFPKTFYKKKKLEKKFKKKKFF